jgi:hypothetical protein
MAARMSASEETSHFTKKASPPCYGDARALLGETQGGGSTDALAAAGDERGASVELGHVCLLGAGPIRP